MIAAFATALKTELTSYVTSVQTAITDNLAVVIPVALGLIGLGLVWRVSKRFAGGK